MKLSTKYTDINKYTLVISSRLRILASYSYYFEGCTCINIFLLLFKLWFTSGVWLHVFLKLNKIVYSRDFQLFECLIDRYFSQFNNSLIFVAFSYKTNIRLQSILSKYNYHNISKRHWFNLRFTVNFTHTVFLLVFFLIDKSFGKTFWNFKLLQSSNFWHLLRYQK